MVYRRDLSDHSRRVSFALAIVRPDLRADQQLIKPCARVSLKFPAAGFALGFRERLVVYEALERDDATSPSSTVSRPSTF